MFICNRNKSRDGRDNSNKTNGLLHFSQIIGKRSAQAVEKVDTNVLDSPRRA